jgi:hypothetical protein
MDRLIHTSEKVFKETLIFEGKRVIIAIIYTHIAPLIQSKIQIQVKKKVLLFIFFFLLLSN